jgi:hypothetical protein
MQRYWNKQLGLSRTGYYHSEDEPIFGTGQGSSNSPAIWLFVSSALMDAYEEWAESAKYSTPTGDCSVDVNMVGFVDDNTGQNNDFFGEPNWAKIDAIVDQALKNAQYWFDLLGASGGSLEYSKCCILIMDWCFSKTGSPFLGMYDDELQQRLAVHNSATGLSQHITLLSAYKPIKPLATIKYRRDHNRSNFANSRNSVMRVQPSYGSAPWPDTKLGRIISPVICQVSDTRSPAHPW